MRKLIVHTMFLESGIRWRMKERCFLENGIYWPLTSTYYAGPSLAIKVWTPLEFSLLTYFACQLKHLQDAAIMGAGGGGGFGILLLVIIILARINY